MNNKLKRLLFLCLTLLVILIWATSCNKESKETDIEQSEGNISNVHKLDNFNYNNLTNEQKEYMQSMYNNLAFTENGMEIYDESFSLIKTVTTSWPKNIIGSLIPEAKYGNIDRIEYSEDFINIYINDAKISDAKDYLKKLKRNGFTENERKDDGKVMCRYDIKDKEGNSVRITYMKENKTLEINAMKIN